MRETRSIRVIAGSLMVAVLLAGFSATQALAQAGQASGVGTVKLTQAAMADGKSLPAGTYTLRVSGDPVNPVLGQAPEAAKWVEFVQGGQVKGRELASVVAPADVKAVLKGTPPAAGTSRVQTLRGADYLRIQFGDKGSQYLVHLAVPPGK